MRNHASALFLSVVLASGLTHSSASTLRPSHLKGIKGANVSVFVDREYRQFDDLELKLTKMVRDVLSEKSLETASSKNVTLSIVVGLHPSALLKQDALIISVETSVREPVSLMRDPALAIPGNNGAVTWTRRAVLIQSRDRVAKAILDEVQEQCGSFAADVISASQGE